MNKAAAEAFMNQQGVKKGTSKHGFTGYVNEQETLVGIQCADALKHVLGTFFNTWDEENASPEEITYIDSICDLLKTPVKPIVIN
ncbi:hypothetical protein V3O24_04560 [Methylobacter sp. Wu8]|uniref:hypothetical protein n=1 Tax=Methylobacter sp. Wu8 TaxID=3118457 RepID=UPI002F339CD6